MNTSSGIVYSRLVRVQVRGQLQYRASFALSMAGTFLFTTLDLVVVLVVFHNISALAGWSASEVILLYAASAVSYALTDIVLGSLDSLPEMVRQGTFDALLIRPRSAFFQLLASDFLFRRAGRLLQAVVVLVVLTAGVLDVDWSPARVGVLVLAVLSGAVIMGAIWVIAASSAFWLDGAGEFVNAFTTGSAFLAQYPLDIYSQWLRQLALFVIPIGFVTYLPLSWVLGKHDVSELPAAARFASPLVAALAAGVAAAVWRLSVKRYRGAGG